MATPGKRPFWLHQAAEYLIGAVFIAQGLQSPTPIVPSVLGGLIMLNTACAKGSLAAFQLFGRRTHRLLDAIVICVIAVAVVQPWVSIDSSTRVIMAALGFVLALIWWQSDFSQPTPRPPRDAAAAPGDLHAASSTPTRPTAEPDGSLPDTIGRTAGRLAGKGVNAYRAKRDQLKR